MNFELLIYVAFILIWMELVLFICYVAFENYFFLGLFMLDVFLILPILGILAIINYNIIYGIIIVGNSIIWVFLFVKWW